MELENGPLREALLAPEAACAMDCEVAEAMNWPVTAWALLLCTPVAVAWALEAEGAKEAVPLAPEADGLWDESVLCAEAADREAAADCGVLRAELRPEADCALGCAAA